MIVQENNLFTMPPETRTSTPSQAPALATPPTRPEPADAGNPEEVLRDRVLDLHEFTSGQILDELRSRMVTLYKDRRAKQGSLAFVTADDARVILDTDPRYEHVKNKNFMGSLFRDKDWEKTGKIIKSKTQGSHANELKCWRWVGWMNGGEA